MRPVKQAVKLRQFEISDMILQEIRTEDLACDWLIANLGMVNSHIAYIYVHFENAG